MNKNLVATMGHNEHEDVLLNNKYDKKYIQNNGYDGLALGYPV